MIGLGDHRRGAGGRAGGCVGGVVSDIFAVPYNAEVQPPFAPADSQK